MVTKDQIEIALGDDKNPFQIKDTDHDVKTTAQNIDQIIYE